MPSEDVYLLKQWIKAAKRVVFFGGAGVSTASGIPDFRGVNGLTHFQNLPVETLLSHDYFMSHTYEFYRFYLNYMIHKNAKPNVVHHYLASLEKIKPELCVITQNIDGLHQKAGSEQVLELHGTIELNRCLNCGRQYRFDELDFSNVIPRCKCQGIIKPEVVLYGEMLDNDILTQAVEAIRKADLLLVCGTSLQVYPAAGLIHEYKGNRLVLINQTKTSFDHYANLVINRPLEEVFSQLD